MRYVTIGTTLWIRIYEEYQTNGGAKADYDCMKEKFKLQKWLAELQKENNFLKKQRYSSQRKLIRGLSIDSIFQELFILIADDIK